MKVLRFFIYTLTSILTGYLILITLCIYLENNKAVDSEKGWRFMEPESETNIKNDCYE